MFIQPQLDVKLNIYWLLPDWNQSTYLTINPVILEVERYV